MTRRTRPSTVSINETAHMYQASQVASRRLIPPAPRPEPILPVAPRGLTTAPLVRSIGCEQSQPFIALPYPTLPALERYETRASFVASKPASGPRGADGRDRVV